MANEQTAQTQARRDLDRSAKIGSIASKPQHMWSLEEREAMAPYLAKQADASRKTALADSDAIASKYMENPDNFELNYGKAAADAAMEMSRSSIEGKFAKSGRPGVEIDGMVVKKREGGPGPLSPRPAAQQPASQFAPSPQNFNDASGGIEDDNYTSPNRSSMNRYNSPNSGNAPAATPTTSSIRLNPNAGPGMNRAAIGQALGVISPKKASAQGLIEQDSRREFADRLGNVDPTTGRRYADQNFQDYSLATMKKLDPNPNKPLYIDRPNGVGGRDRRALTGDEKYLYMRDQAKVNMEASAGLYGVNPPANDPNRAAIIRKNNINRSDNPSGPGIMTGTGDGPIMLNGWAADGKQPAAPFSPRTAATALEGMDKGAAGSYIASLTPEQRSELRQYSTIQGTLAAPASVGAPWQKGNLPSDGGEPATPPASSVPTPFAPTSRSHAPTMDSKGNSIDPGRYMYMPGGNNGMSPGVGGPGYDIRSKPSATPEEQAAPVPSPSMASPAAPQRYPVSNEYRGAVQNEVRYPVTGEVRGGSEYRAPVQNQVMGAVQDENVYPVTGEVRGAAQSQIRGATGEQLDPATIARRILNGQRAM